MRVRPIYGRRIITFCPKPDINLLLYNEEKLGHNETNIDNTKRLINTRIQQINRQFLKNSFVLRHFMRGKIKKHTEPNELLKKRRVR